MRFLRAVLAAVAVALLAAGSASAKEIRPGDLYVCNSAKCVGIVDHVALKRFSAFYYGPGGVTAAAAPSSTAIAFRLRLNENIVGVAATKRLDRVLVYGVYCGRFERGVWYVLPRRAAAALRRVTAGLVPQHVPRRIPPSC
jgi:hypothetical protein